MLRWLITLAVCSAAVAAGVAETSRLLAAMDRNAAADAFYDGDLETALDRYERVAARLPGRPYSYIDPADSIASSLSTVTRSPEETRELAHRGIRLYLRGLAMAPTAAWPYSRIGILVGRLGAGESGEGRLLDLGVLSGERPPTPWTRLEHAALLHAVETEPNNYFYRDFLARFYLQQGRLQAGARHVRRAVALQPVLERHYFLGEMFEYSQTVLNAVLAGADDALENPETRTEPSQIHRFLGETFFRRGDYDAAREAFERAAESASHPYPLHVQVGRMWARQHRHEEALTAFDRAIELEPMLWRGLVQRGLSLAELGRHEEAIDDFRRARGLAPTDFQPGWVLATELERAGKPDEAIDVLETLGRAHPEREQVKTTLVRLFRETNRDSKALAVARELARNHPDREVYQELLRQLEREQRKR